MSILFNSFMDEHFGRSRKGHRPEPEDVDFTEIGHQNETRNYDENSRSDQIRIESQKFHAQLQDPIAAIVHSLVWSLVANWADKHPIDNHQPVRQWQEEGLKYFLHRLQKEYSTDMRIELTLQAIFLTGMQWASDNPPEK